MKLSHAFAFAAITIIFFLPTLPAMEQSAAALKPYELPQTPLVINLQDQSPAVVFYGEPAELENDREMKSCLRGQIWIDSEPVVGVIIGQGLVRKHHGGRCPSRGWLFELPYDQARGWSSQLHDFYQWLISRHIYGISDLHFSEVFGNETTVDGLPGHVGFCSEQHVLFAALASKMADLLRMLSELTHAAKESR